ncbi:sensor histidine kinase [Nocardioides sp. GCM10027113]|uniref:sensor histidine kinase n=1 Tax=unclassified Nocardioides TaxID=2615069 RepID=UPI00360ED49D
MTPHPHLPHLVVGGRVFGLLLLTTPLLWSRDAMAALALLAVAAVWLATSAAEWLGVRRTPLLVADAAAIGTVAALALDATIAVLGALAIPPFTAALRRGPRGMLLALSAELTTLVALALWLRGGLSELEGTGAVTWAVTGLGLGLIGSFVRTTGQSTADPLAPYRLAQSLIRRLIGLSGDLSSGLDAETVATSVVGAVKDELPVAFAAIHVPREKGLAPLLTEPGGTPGEIETLLGLGETALASGRPVVSGRTFAFPLMTDAGPVAVVSGLTPDTLDLDQAAAAERLATLSERLEPAAVHLDTALLFAALRDTATRHERHRLAREMHDGVAQEIASLGYAVDGLAATAADGRQRDELQALRRRITDVVAEVRRSVQTLRTDMGGSPSLGAAIGSLGRHLSDSSGIPIIVTADERPTRLRAEVEAELLRIAQEAMTNAVRHSDATRIEVTCRVDAPTAEISVRDDGAGLRPGRKDSFGLEIMRERARLVGAELEIERARPHGTLVSVRLAPSTARPSAPSSTTGVSA